MHVETRETTHKGKTCVYHYLRQSYREGRKVGHHRIASLSHCSDEEVEAIRLALKHKELRNLPTAGPEWNSRFSSQ